MSRGYYEESGLRAVSRWCETRSQTIASGYRSSRLRAGLDRFESVTRQSWIVRWLTAEPEPDVIVIDLTEARTVGPVIDVLDGLGPHGERIWSGSTTRQVLDRARGSSQVAPVRSVSALLLGIVMAQFVLTLGNASRLLLAALCFLAAPALVGLRITWAWDELRESKIGQFTLAVFKPPEQHDDDRN